MLQDEPFGHSGHSSTLVSRLRSPAAYRPLAQGSCADEPRGQTPSVHCKHCVKPSLGAYVPTAHAGQMELLCSAAEVPRGQGVQLSLLVSSSLGWYLPGSHETQPALLLRPMAADQRPAAQGVKTMLVSAPSSSQ